MTKSMSWRRSSRSQSGSECVELAHTLDSIRDSKNPAATLIVPTHSFIESARQGHLVRWQRSSRSINGSDCVELAHSGDAVRDSKNPRDLLVVPTLGLIESVRHGHLAHGVPRHRVG